MYTISSLALKLILESKTNNNGSNFTIKSNITGTEYTYKISRSLFKNNWYTHLFVETNYLNFNYLGAFINGKIIKKNVIVQTPSAKALQYVLNKVHEDKITLLDKQIKIMHTGYCLKCNRELTDSNSIEIGLGPTCRKG